MQDLTERLHRLRPAEPRPASDDAVVAADLARGRAAVRRQRMRRGGVAATALVSFAAIASLLVAGTSGQPNITSDPAPATPTLGSATPSSTPGASVTSSTSRGSVDNKLELVAYHGKQRPGFRIAKVPSGYVLQGVTGSTLDIAAAGDRSSLDSFVGKLTVGIEENGNGTGLDVYQGHAVTVRGRRGVIQAGGDVTTLVFLEGHGSNNVVIVQRWHNIALTNRQLLDFAAGITVTTAARRQHG